MTTTGALTWMGVLAGIGVAIDSVAGLWARAALSDTGIFAFGPLQTGWKRCLHGPASRPLSWLFEYPRVLVLFVAQLAAVAALLAVPWLSESRQALVAAAGASVVLAARMLLHARNHVGNDGADQMALVVFTSVLVGWLTIGTRVAVVAVCYAALQLLLSYSVAGLAKLSSRTWRDGTAVPAILNTAGLGSPALARLLRPHRTLAWALCWSVIAFECLVPAWLLMGTRGVYIVIALGCMFHAGVAVTLGLNTFFWSFDAAYPALIVLGERTGVI